MVFPGGSVAAAFDVAHVIIRIASAIERVRTVVLQWIPANSMSQFSNLHISVPPFGINA
jgi:hypothetical protein